MSYENRGVQTRPENVPLGQVLRKDLPIALRRKIIDSFNNAIQLYSDFATIFALNVQLNMLKFAMSSCITAESNRVQMDSIIPHEFRVSSTTIEFPAAPTTHENNDAKRQSDYKTLFRLSHLQVINTLKFGVSGIQKETQNNYPLWIELNSSDNAQTVQDNDVNKELQEFV
ncbi:hypothetical protein INT48_007872 [Thamnidium elegans]|uniref:Uncharacterized protein n=1 Tax=Thamnidium elegans TaxID=101142 RepID=A0A8H7STV6_9FUNG|nr:hypothetical protein INT48_007872 [Thamnidium elegans]